MIDGLSPTPSTSDTPTCRGRQPRLPRKPSSVYNASALMWARTRFDIRWSDLAFGALVSLLPRNRDAAQARLEARWAPDGGGLACYSVRSAFDLLLRVLDLPPGSEVLFSAINIKGMIKAAERFDLVPIPVDLDITHAAPRLDALERAITPQSRVLVVAHLFGGRVDLGPVLQLARRHRLFVVEDCAQAFDGPGDTGHPEVDAALFSFGPLKTATALGGALARIRDPELLARMRGEQQRYPVQSRRAYFMRILKFGGVKAFAYRVPYTALVGIAGLMGRDLDISITDSVRGIAKQKSARSLRRRACAPMLAVIERRLTRWRQHDLDARVHHARVLVDCVRDVGVCPGANSDRHSFWACTVLAKDPRSFVAAMRERGFDASPSVSLKVVRTPDGRRALEPVCAQQMLSQLVFLPCYPAMKARHVEREARALKRAFQDDQTLARLP